MPEWSLLGTISGTSADGIDLAELRTDGKTITDFGPTGSADYRPETRAKVLQAAAGKGQNRSAWPEISKAVTDDHATAIARFLENNRLRPDAIVFHGQTVWHDPKAGETVQLGDPQDLANRLNVPVIGDVRLADMEAGGEGAPLVPVYHRSLARTMIADRPEPLCFLNIGGVSNLTYIEADNLHAFDIGPGNALLDDWVRRHGRGDYDADGAISSRGNIEFSRLSKALNHPFLRQIGPKSLDRYSFDAHFVEGLNLEDGAATLLAFTAEAIAMSERLLPKVPGLWIVCGGGRHNSVLMTSLADKLSGKVVSADHYRIDGDGLEAQAMAFLGARKLAGLPTSYPQTTGAREPVVGGRLFKPAV